MKAKFLSVAILSAVSLGANASDSLSVSPTADKKMPEGTVVNRVYSTADGSKVRRAFSKLTRYEDKVCVSSTTHGLPAGAYTNWWMVFNNPEACENPRPFGNGRCGGPDVANPDVDATVMWAAGGIIDVDGSGHFSACLTENELTHYFLMGSGNGLTDASKAELQVVFRHHGPVEPEYTSKIGEQLTTFPGGCANPDEGVEGFACANLQVTVHASPANK